MNKTARRRGPRRTEYTPGQVAGPYGVVFLKEIAPLVNKNSGVKARRGVFKCPMCGSEFESYINNVKHGITRSCGCYFKSVDKHRSEEYKKGDIVGPNNAVFIKYTGKDSRSNKLALFACGFCGNEFESKVTLVKNGNVKSCGCLKARVGKMTQNTEEVNKAKSDNPNLMTIEEIAIEYNVTRPVVSNAIKKFPDSFIKLKGARGRVLIDKTHPRLKALLIERSKAYNDEEYRSRRTEGEKCEAEKYINDNDEITDFWNWLKNLCAPTWYVVNHNAGYY